MLLLVVSFFHFFVFLYIYLIEIILFLQGGVESIFRGSGSLWKSLQRCSVA